ncbi:unnamed protein product [Linum trigynum]|uniref:Uncharacterized protein n=1 Tax=Linum trigynum TaxID=586398 RepID=A0AAV2FP46_9ROSI
MALNVQIISEETIKPSSLAPEHLKIHKLSCMDQAAPPRYTPILLSYPDTQIPSSYQQGAMVVEKLKSSLSETLSHYYPFAGRYRDDGYSIDCNDKGVAFVVAHVSDDKTSSSSTGGLEEEEVLQLMPCHPQETWVDDNGELVLLAIRVNFFESTGISIGICAWHGVCDGPTISFFAQSWAAICRGDPQVQRLLNGNAVVDYGSMFPAHQSLDYIRSMGSYFDTSDDHKKRTAVKQFVVPGPKIDALREEITRSTGKRPSRVVVVSSLVWAAAIRVSQEKRKARRRRDEEDDMNELHSAAIIVNIRPRTNPPLPPMCMGNLFQRSATAKWPIKEEAAGALSKLAGRLGDVVRGVDAEFLSKAHENGGEGYKEFMRSWWEEYEKEDFIVITSLCGYGKEGGVDFGWGNPGSTRGYARSNKTISLMDAKDGQGIEVWATLDKDDMAIFEKDPTWSN